MEKNILIIISLLKLLVEINLNRYINLLPKIILKNDLDNLINSYMDRFILNNQFYFQPKQIEILKILTTLSNDFKN